MPNTQPAIVPHGTLDYDELRALGLRPEELTLFSSNINPFGPPPATVAALRAAATAEMIARYPDRLSYELRVELAATHNLPIDSILVGNGSADLLWLLGLHHLQNRRIAILGPTFGEYENIANIMQAEIIEIAHPSWQKSANGYAPGLHPIEAIATEIHQAAADVIFVCNPNNPTGQYLTPSELDALYTAAPHALWIIDEAYAEFMQPPATTASWIHRGNWLVLRSMTKDFALGGLRLGYLLGAPNLIQTLQTLQSPWNVNTFAQLAGLVSLREGKEWREQTITRLHHETVLLQAQLQQIGYQPMPTHTNYFLLPVADAAVLRQSLLEHRIVVRDCTSFGLPNYIRIATQRPDTNSRLLQILGELTHAHA